MGLKLLKSVIQAFVDYVVWVEQIFKVTFYFTASEI